MAKYRNFRVVHKSEKAVKAEVDEVSFFRTRTIEVVACLFPFVGSFSRFKDINTGEIIYDCTDFYDVITMLNKLYPDEIHTYVKGYNG